MPTLTKDSFPTNATPSVTITFKEDSLVAFPKTTKPVTEQVISTRKISSPTNIGYVITATFSRTCNGIGSFTISILDPSWHNVEEAILKYKGLCIIEYGYLYDENITTPPINARIMNYKLDYKMNHVIVTVFGLLIGYDSITVKNWELTKTNINDIIYEICSVLNVKEGMIEAASGEALVFTDFDKTSKGVLKIGQAEGETPLQLITQKLIANAVPQDKKSKGPFIFSISFRDRLGKPASEPYLHFCTPTYKELWASSDIIHKYEQFGNEIDTRIQEYKPSWNATLVQIQGGAGIVNNSFDYVTGERNIFATEAALVDEEKKMTASGGLPGPLGPNQVQVQQDLITLFPLSADLLIRGDPTYEILDPVEFIVRIPPAGGINYANKIHKMSGIFLVNKITDNISKDGFNTQLSLMISPTTYKKLQQLKLSNYIPDTFTNNTSTPTTPISIMNRLLWLMQQ